MTIEELKKQIDETMIGKQINLYYNNVFNLLSDYVKQFIDEEFHRDIYVTNNRNKIVVYVLEGFFNKTITNIYIELERKNIRKRFDNPIWILDSYVISDNIEEECVKLNQRLRDRANAKNEKFNSAKADFETIRSIFPDKSYDSVLAIIENIYNHRFKLNN